MGCTVLNLLALAWKDRVHKQVDPMSKQGLWEPMVMLLQTAWWIKPCFIFILAVSSGPTHTTAKLSIDCGSTGVSTAAHSKGWAGDNHPNFTIKGRSTRSSINGELMTSVDLVPYKTARISRSQFSYIFQLSSGQKLIRLHFYPTLYYGFQNCQDLFTVEAGSFTLLSNFSASITSDALAVNFFVKEFYVIVEEYQPLRINFYPSTATGQSQDICAFVNGIEIVSVPESLSYYHTGDIGVKVVGKKSMVYLDNETALELVHRRNLRLDSVSVDDDFQGMFGSWTSVRSRKVNKVSNITWKIPVDVGFSYLVRLHFSDLGTRFAETGQDNFLFLIDHVIVSTYVREREDKHDLLYWSYIVIAKGCKNEGKRDILISLQLINVSIYRHGPFEGFEIFKLSNHANSLAGPNPLPPLRDSPSMPIQVKLSVFGLRSTHPTVFITVICLVNIAVHMLRKACEYIFTEEENTTSTKATRLIRCFSLHEIQLATKNFQDALVVGKGGFGIVYKGLIDNGQETVAVKRLKPNSRQGKREFLKEIETLSKLRHTNLVPLIGYCNEQEEMILVYAYMANGNLADHLYKLARKNMNYSSLSWEDRLKICIGAGRGLDFLHTGHGVIHRDVKASNILLDETFVAKVSDFGLVKTEKDILLQSQDISNPKGTPGYFDPDYVRTCKLTTKSDTYSFGVVLLELLCGRPAVDPLVEEDQRSLTMWALDNICRGQVDHIVAPSLRWEISSNSLKAFVWIVKKCLHDEPNRRPTIAHVVLNLEFALVLQKDRYLTPYKIASVANVPCIGKTYKENVKSLLPGIAGITDFLPTSMSIYGSTVASTMQNVQSLLKEQTDNKFLNDEPPHVKKGGKNILHKISRVLNITSLLKEQTKSKMLNVEPQYEKKEGAKSMFHKVSRVLNVTSLLIKHNKSNVLNAEPPYEKKEGGKSMIHHLSHFSPRETTLKEVKESNRNDFGDISISAPLSYQGSKMIRSRGKTSFQEQMLSTSGGGNDLISDPNFRIFLFSELKTATNNFRADMCLGEGGFGRVYKGFLEDKSTNKNGSESIVAVKRLNSEAFQGFKEWQSEVNILGKLSHPNVVKLLGCCSQDKELLLVYEFMEKGSLDDHLFKKNSAVQPLSWNIRLKILTGAARGLSYLHALDVPIIFRDYKTSNLLLDELYNVKLSDFGLARLGPEATHSYVTTAVMGTYGYAAPEYVETGHLYIKSDVFSFGVTLLEMLTGLRVIDVARPHKNLIDLIKPKSVKRKELKKVMDSSLKGNYPPKSAFQLLQLAVNCLKRKPTRRPSMEEVVELLEKIDIADANLRIKFRIRLVAWLYYSTFDALKLL